MTVKQETLLEDVQSVTRSTALVLLYDFVYIIIYVEEHVNCHILLQYTISI